MRGTSQQIRRISDARECPSVRAGLAVFARLGMMGDRTSEHGPSLVASREPSVGTGLAFAARLGMTEDASLLSPVAAAAAATLSSAVGTVVGGAVSVVAVGVAAHCAAATSPASFFGGFAR